MAAENRSCRYSIDTCDVHDKPALIEYRTKRMQWLDWLNDDVVHSIWGQISAALWNDVAFRSIVRIGENHPDGALGNSLLIAALIEGHFAGQVLVIRRLFDNRRDVISLRRLVSEIQANVHLFTRENYVSHDGLPYDFQAVERETMLAHLRSGDGPYWEEQQGPMACRASERLHLLFDRLSGVRPDARQRTDRISKLVIDEVADWLDESDAEEVVKWSHKMLAHAADRASRSTVDLPNLNPNLDKLGRVHRGMVRVAEAVGAFILADSGRGMVVSVSQFNQFEKLSEPVMGKDALPSMHGFWLNLSKERDGWLNGTLEAMIARVGTV